MEKNYILLLVSLGRMSISYHSLVTNMTKLPEQKLLNSILASLFMRKRIKG